MKFNFKHYRQFEKTAFVNKQLDILKEYKKIKLLEITLMYEKQKGTCNKWKAII